MKKIILATILAMITIGISYADGDGRSCTVYNSNGNTARLTKLSITSDSKGNINYTNLVELTKPSNGKTIVNVEVLDYSTGCRVGLLNVSILNLFNTNNKYTDNLATGFAPNTTYLLRIGKGTCE